MFELRKYKNSDCPAIAGLFYDTVHTVNRADYTEEQVNAWAAGKVDLEAWDRSIIGFGDMDETGYLDRLYVHKDHQREGIATAICNVLESEAASRPGVVKITTHASITARPFFLSRGYRAVKEQQVEGAGVLLTNYVMEKGIKKRQK